MRPPYVTSELLNDFIDRAFQEDLGDGDHSTLASIPADAEKSAYLLMKESGVIAGMDLAPLIFHKLDPNMTIEPLAKDGEEVKKGDIILRLKGKVRAILSGERLLLNCMQRMSGIATKTAYLNTLIKGTSARLLDTRKTTPNMRMLEKWAVIIGGGVNHRYGLYDMVMLKDNHVDFAGGIEKAVYSTREYLKAKGLKLKIEVETRNLDEVQQALDAGGVDRIMLDNMSNEDMRAAVELIAKRSETEASGGITEKTIRSVAETGVDYISVGALTHSIKSLDISLKAE
ncbi:carboxylating nicotinate-nucleotide diphosphorylase [Roseivirga spongicola]|uniref:Probable nicotinate-nucleotide pyrophosphorylase [carboxylating] n=1 Tax=Roseivirga spongicola TaxID=333140 RepID=A0A150XGM1_9BACT|nr:carboxylating nicotinate-nucleotide diphosphorylase [Roseivirga spongicola]KYG77834.1 nicotinate-nucleotide pyrophosphorylase [Roseivirga spongicola]WPZ11562.1 carboxylating nicotinate-nucleotide diphosphorylase [Roseivirga spongicola]